MKHQKINVSSIFSFPVRFKTQGNIIFKQIRGSFLIMLNYVNTEKIQQKQDLTKLTRD